MKSIVRWSRKRGTSSSSGWTPWGMSVGVHLASFVLFLQSWILEVGQCSLLRSCEMLWKAWELMRGHWFASSYPDLRFVHEQRTQPLSLTSVWCVTNWVALHHCNKRCAVFTAPSKCVVLYTYTWAHKMSANRTLTSNSVISIKHIIVCWWIVWLHKPSLTNGTVIMCWTYIPRAIRETLMRSEKAIGETTEVRLL